MKIFLVTKVNKLAKILVIIFLTTISMYSLYISKNPLDTTLCNSSFSKEFINKITNLINGNEKIAYLTFDDGPTSLVTSKILDILKSENIKSTFFVIGKSVEANPEMVKRAYEEGHYIANHSYSHNNSILYKNSECFIEEIRKTDLAIGKAIGVDNYCSHIFRFPNGFMAPMYKYEKQKSITLLQEMNYAYIDWNCLNNDSMKKYSNEQLLYNLRQSCKDKNTLVILMHDTKDVNDSSLVLKESILYLKSQGYIFKNFYELF